MFDNLAI